MSTSGNLNSAAANATLQCLTGCAIGEILGLMIGTARDADHGHLSLSIGLAFLFAFTLCTLPLLQPGLRFFLGALSVALAADTLSIGVRG